MKNRRKHERFHAEILEIKGKMLLAKHVKILDISTGGISLKADRRLNIGHEYSLKIEGKGKNFQVKGTVVWSLLGESMETLGGEVVPVYKAGMKFTDVSESTYHEIHSFISLFRQESEKLYATEHRDISRALLTLQEEEAESLRKLANNGEASSLPVNEPHSEYMFSDTGRKQ